MAVADHHPIDGGHETRRADDIVRAIEAELWFSGRAAGFEQAGDIESAGTDGRH